LPAIAVELAERINSRSNQGSAPHHAAVQAVICAAEVKASETTEPLSSRRRLVSMDYIPAAGSITMFSTTWCGYCARLKSQLSSAGISYREINIEEVDGTVELVERLNGGNQTVPTVLFSDGTSATNPSLAEVVARL